jgi:carboxypeptidase T
LKKILKKIITHVAALSILFNTALLSSTPAFADDVAAQHQLLEQEKQTVNIYKAYFPNLDIGKKTAISFHAQLLQSNYQGGYLILELDAADMDKLRNFGFKFEQATDYIARRNQLLSRTQALNLQTKRAASATTDVTAPTDATSPTPPAAPRAQSIPNFSCYETVEETFAAMQDLATRQPTLASVVNIGSSWEKTQGSGGYDMRVLKLTNSATDAANTPKPKLFINSAIHAREYATAPLVLEFARWLVNGYGNNADATWILDHHEVHLLLQTNPDGRKKAESGLSWRKNTNNQFCANSNNRGIDLNRNFSATWNITNGEGSSEDACNLTFRGPAAGSEPEVKALETYLRNLWPDRRGPNQNDAAPSDTSGIHLDIHSFSQLVLWPWGISAQPAPNGAALQTLGRKLAFFNGYTPQQSIGLYPTDGASDSISYAELGVAAFTIELGTDFFESCTIYNQNIKPGNLPALIYAAKVVRTPYITPAGPDVINLNLGKDASNKGVKAGTSVSLRAVASDARYNNSNGSEPTQAITGAEYYIDTPPWAAGAAVKTLNASDGTFNASTENLAGFIYTSGLAPGKHIVYVRARDASNTWGAVSAVFLNIIPGAPPAFTMEAPPAD